MLAHMLHHSASISSDYMAAQVFTDRDESNSADLDVANVPDTISVPDCNDPVFKLKAPWSTPIRAHCSISHCLAEAIANAIYNLNIVRG